MRFTKMQGAGNDYVYVDCFNNPMPGDPPIARPLSLTDHALKVTCVSMGNPHCVTFVDTLTDALVLVTGPEAERHPAFPRRTNVEFVRVLEPDDVTVRVWERGSGETLACGTGACADAVAVVVPGQRPRRPP